MDIQIHSFDSIEKLAKNPFTRVTALISIGDVNSEPPTLVHKPKQILRLNFDDIYLSDIDYENCGSYAFRLFSLQQAKQIVDFVYKHKDEVDLFICQCQYGQSRSAAVAAAIKEHFDHNGIEIFADERYCPNNNVFHLMTDAFNSKECS